MRAPDINPIAEIFATAAGLCFIAIAITFQLMRKKANEQIPRGHRVSWLMATAMKKTVIANYRRSFPAGWEYRGYRAFQILWAAFVILAILALFFGPAT